MHANNVNKVIEDLNNLKRSTERVREYVLDKLQYSQPAQVELEQAIDAQCNTITQQIEELKTLVQSARTS